MTNVKNTNEQVGVELKVVRELLDSKTKAGEDMYCYVLRDVVRIKDRTGVIKEREIRVDFAAKDLGGYDMLDIIFMVDDEAYLSMHEEYMTDDKTGEVTPYTVYEIWNEDEDGIIYSYKVKPMRESDKAKLNTIVQKKVLALEKAAAENAKNSDTAKKSEAAA